MSASVDISHAPVESWDVEKVLPYPENHKVHKPEQVAALAKSIADQGLNDPITVDKDGVIISGHGRLEAVKKLGWKKVAVRWLKMLTKEQADKLRIAANKTASTEYDFDVLQRELSRLADAGEDLTTMGFDDRELEMLIGDMSIDTDAITKDLDSAVDKFSKETKEAAGKAAEEDVSTGKAFGFTKVTPAFAKVIKRFMGAISEGGKVSADEALHAHMQRHIESAA